MSSQHFSRQGYCNPAFSDSRQGLFLASHYQQFLGIFKGVNAKSFWGNYSFGRKDSLSSLHKVGIRVNNEKEGTFIARNKYYLSYSWHINVFNQFWMSSGLYLGWANYQYLGNDSYTQGTDGALDGDFGVSFYKSNDFSFGLVTSQFPNSIIEPRDFKFRWKRHFLFQTNKVFKVSNCGIIGLLGQLRIRENTSSLLDLGVRYIYKNRYNVEIDFSNLNRYSIGFGIANLGNERHRLSIFTNYTLPLFVSAGSFQQYLELMLTYHVRTE